MIKDRVVMLRSGRQGTVMPGHPWLYARQFLKPDPRLKGGDIVAVKRGDGTILGTGYYNPKSEIIVRLLAFEDVVPDQEFFNARMSRAIEKRRALPAKTNAYRAVFSEADGLPGLIVDVYNDTAVVQILTLGMERLEGFVIAAIRATLAPKYIYEKSDSPYRKIEGLKDARGWWGEAGSTMIEISEAKAKFIVDIEHGHKTGFYLDQRNARLALHTICKGKRVLDLFSYTGAFAIQALLSGAVEAVGVDIKEEWLERARQNAQLNSVSDRASFIKADAFDYVKKIAAEGGLFDIIIVDPPSFLKARHALVMASKGYKELNLAALKILKPGGVLATFSCSHNMPNAVFAGVLKEACREAGRKSQILKRCHQAEDHPIVRAIPETEYLKGYFLRID